MIPARIVPTPAGPVVQLHAADALKVAAAVEMLAAAIGPDRVDRDLRRLGRLARRCAELAQQDVLTFEPPPRGFKLETENTPCVVYSVGHVAKRAGVTAQALTKRIRSAPERYPGTTQTGGQWLIPEPDARRLIEETSDAREDRQDRHEGH